MDLAVPTSFFPASGKTAGFKTKPTSSNFTAIKNVFVGNKIYCSATLSTKKTQVCRLYSSTDVILCRWVLNNSLWVLGV